MQLAWVIRIGEPQGVAQFNHRLKPTVAAGKSVRPPRISLTLCKRGT